MRGQSFVLSILYLPLNKEYIITKKNSCTSINCHWLGLDFNFIFKKEYWIVSYWNQYLFELKQCQKSNWSKRGSCELMLSCILLSALSYLFTVLKAPLRVRQFFCFWKLFVALNNCEIFFALRQTWTAVLDFKVVDLEVFRRSALFTTAETWRSVEVWH